MTPRALLLFITLAWGCGEGAQPIVPPPPPPPPPPGTLRIMMLGNSLTSTQDVPGMVADFAEDGGALRPIVASITHTNWSLEEHAGSSASVAAMQGGEYDVIVLQQGPTTLPDSRNQLSIWAGKIRDLTAPQTRLGLFVSWPPEGGALDDGIANHTTVAQQLSLALYPVGHAFREAKRLDPTIPLYGSDGFHQTATGSALAGMVIAAVIFDQDPSGYPNPLPTIITEDDMVTLRAAARTVVNAYGVQ